MKRVIILLLLLLGMPAVATTPNVACRDELETVGGGCPTYPPSFCIQLNVIEGERSCCTLGGLEGNRQMVRKEYWDCEGEGYSTCEYRFWYYVYDPGCPDGSSGGW